MKKDKKNKNNWKEIQNQLIKKCLDVKPHFTPSGRLKTTDKLNYREVIEKASRSMIRFKKPTRLIRMIVRIIAEQVRVLHTGVLLYREKNNSYVLIDSKGEEGKRLPIGYVRLPLDSPLITAFMEKKSFLIDSHGALLLEKITKTLNDADLLKKQMGMEHKIKRLKSEMDILRSEVCIPAYYKRKLLGILILGPKLSGEKYNDDEIGFFATLANDVAMAITNSQLITSLQSKVKEIGVLYEKERRLFIHTSIALAAAIDARDPYTHGHTSRVTHYSLKIADELKQAPEIMDYENFRETLHIASLLHDIGKIGVRDNILNKADALTGEEYIEVKKHADIGAAILSPIKELGGIIEIVRAHHERFDGTGYPGGLEADEIPFPSRIISVADVFDTVTTDRPYRKKIPDADAVKEIEKNSGTQFDPLVVQAFVDAYNRGKEFLNPTYSGY
ncbi:MAG: HD domain-containing protein [Candidatus Omnitrophica bacterium]|nr:HD domain-containing protein [Candidatus Omnitrophota bacterium]